MTDFFNTRGRRAMAIFLAADLFVFVALFAAYIYLRRQVPAWPGAFHFASGLMAFAITLFAFSGSFAMHFSVRYQLNKGYDVAMRLVVATLAVVGSVVILLGMEWVRLFFIVEATFSNNPWGVPAFSWCYFGLTGFYAIHLLIGFIYLSVVASKIETVDTGSATLYVHFTNIVWLLIFIGIYLSSTDLQGI
jgi:hypothetical protein